jgi:hypothetical protein
LNYDHLIAVDPGPTQSAYVSIDKTGWGPEIVGFGKIDNDAMRLMLIRMSSVGKSVMAIEMIASYGMAVGAEVFETCVWIGRFIEACGVPFVTMYRRDVKMFLCGNNSAKDANIRQALIDRYGGKEKAIGKKKSPGPLYGIHDDVWAALALAETWIGTRGKQAA